MTLAYFTERPLLKLLARALAFFALLMIPWPGLASNYARTFCAAGNALAPDLARVSLHFEPLPPPLGEREPWTVTLLARQKQSPARLTFTIDTRTLAYLPTAAFLALIWATPLGDRRRELRIFLLGLLAMELVVALLIALPVIVVLGGGSQVTAFALGPRLMATLNIAHRALVVPPGMTYEIPLLVWLGVLVASRSFELKQLFRAPGPRATSSSR